MTLQVTQRHTKAAEIELSRVNKSDVEFKVAFLVHWHTM